MNVHSKLFFLPSPSRIHSVCANDSADYFHSHIDEQLASFGLKDSAGETLRSIDLVDIIEGYKGQGAPTEEELSMWMGNNIYVKGVCIKDST